MAAHEKERFAERLDYISSPGYLTNGEARKKYHWPGGGPSATITNLGILQPDPVTKKFFLDAYFNFYSVEQIIKKIPAGISKYLLM